MTWAEILLIPTGAFSVAFVATANATLQLNSSQEMRGRVMSLHGMAFLGTTPIGAPLVGAIIAASDPRVGLLVGAASALAAAGLLRGAPAAAGARPGCPSPPDAGRVRDRAPRNRRRRSRCLRERVW